MLELGCENAPVGMNGLRKTYQTRTQGICNGHQHITICRASQNNPICTVVKSYILFNMPEKLFSLYKFNGKYGVAKNNYFHNRHITETKTNIAL